MEMNATLVEVSDAAVLLAADMTFVLTSARLMLVTPV